jgi:hypothetical protein
MLVAATPDERARVAVVDSITKLNETHRASVVVAGSHGGLYCGWRASTVGLRAVVLNDAGVGLEDAGIACLEQLDRVGIAAATVDHNSARIGDGQDMLRRGRVSHVNATADALGCAAGMALVSCVAFLRAASLPSGVLPPVSEGRFVLADRASMGVEVVGVDSASLVVPQDKHSIVVTGSHGGLLGGLPASAIRHPCLAAAFNDAGGGADGAGYGRLPVLDEMGIAAVTVSHMSARIGDARSSWATGWVSAANRLAAQAGVQTGMALQSAACCLAIAQSSH